MAETFLQVYADIAREVGLNPTITEFSENDGSADIVQWMNAGYRHLLGRIRNDGVVENGTGSLSLVDGTRTYSVASDMAPNGIYTWGMKNTTDSYSSLKAATKEFIHRQYSNYLTYEAQPEYYYYEDMDTVAFYPVPDASYTVSYEYRKQPTESTSETATFGIPDDWLDYIKKHAQLMWEKRNGLGSWEGTLMEREEILHRIVVNQALAAPATFTSSVVIPNRVTGWSNTNA